MYTLLLVTGAIVWSGIALIILAVAVFYLLSVTERR